MGYDDVESSTRWQADEEESFLHKSNKASRSKVQLGLIRKVYTLLTLQLVVGTLVVGAAFYSEGFGSFLENNFGFMVFNSIALLVTTCVLHSFRHSYPLNLVLLGFFTISASLLAASASIMYDSEIVIMAAFTTLSVFIGLTIHAFTTRDDYRYMHGGLAASLSMLILFSFVRMFLPHITMIEVGLSIIGAIVFSLYIICDTQRLITHKNPDDYIILTLELYLDILNLFLEILRLIAELKEK